MNKLQQFMLNHPYISIAAILPFALLFVLGVFTILLNIILPGILALWLTGWIYSAILGRSFQQFYRRPFWYVRYD